MLDPLQGGDDNSNRAGDPLPASALLLQIAAVLAIRRTANSSAIFPSGSGVSARNFSSRRHPCNNATPPSFSINGTTDTDFAGGFAASNWHVPAQRRASASRAGST